MTLTEVIAYMADHLEVCIDVESRGDNTVQEIIVRLKLGENVISKSEATIYLD